MAQVFRPRANTISRTSINLLGIFIVLSSIALYLYVRSSYRTGQHLVIEQPVPFSHKHHVQGLGIDCRYCHTAVETSASAGMPATQTCMQCHSQIWSDAPMLAPVRESWATGRPLRWRRVHDLPDYVYFNHSIHVNKGVGCSTCHGQVDEMPLTWKDQTLFMEWCLKCHRAPEENLRPRDKVFDMAWRVSPRQDEEGEKLVLANHVQKVGLTNCSVCHR